MAFQSHGRHPLRCALFARTLEVTAEAEYFLPPRPFPTHGITGIRTL